MSDAASDLARLTVEEYLAREECAVERHEYVAGQVYAMTGATVRHNLIAGNVFAKLRGAAAGGSCHVFMNDLKVRAARDVFYYPDVVVVCGPIDESAVFVDTPCLIVEVTSPSTESTDRREKLVAYRQLESLRAYLIVSHRRRAVDVYLRDAAGEWQSERVAEAVVGTPCPSSVLSLDEIYAGVTLPAVSEPEPVRYDTVITS